MESDIWLDIRNWPETIQNGDKIYKISFMYPESETKSRVVGDKKEIKPGTYFSATYDFENFTSNAEEKDYYYGPAFGWRSDGTIYLKQFYEKDGSYESYYIFPNGQRTLINQYDSSSDVRVELVYMPSGQLIGYYKIYNCKRDEASDDNIFHWNGEKISSEEYSKNMCSFWRTLKRDLSLKN